MTTRKKFALAVAFQFLILSGVVARKVYTLVTGVDVLLKIQPVDPRDPLRGDYLTFRYDISSVQPHYNYVNGETVFVLLNEKGKFATAAFASREMPKDPQAIFIKGKWAAGGESKFPPVHSAWPRSGNARVIYGIEEYFIPEGKGADFSWQGEIYARVAVDSGGHAVLKRIYIDEKPWP